jgi:GR25 family glycosyltransferase involved in LPS biosynthesis
MLISKEKENEWTKYTNIYVINVKKRADRLNSFMEQWFESRITTENLFRVDAVSIENSPGLGCSKSHIKALIHFIRSGQQYGMILEDDFTFRDTLTAKNELNYLFHYLGDIFDVFLLVVGPYPGSFQTYESFDKFARVKSAATTVGYIVSKGYARTLLRNYIESSTFLESGGFYKYRAIDVHWNRLMEMSSSKWFSYNNYTATFAIQSSGMSDISNDVADVDIDTERIKGTFNTPLGNINYTTVSNHYHLKKQYYHK